MPEARGSQLKGMATILSCGACSYPIVANGIAPPIMAEREMDVSCPECGAAYNVLIRMTREPSIHRLEEIVRRNNEAINSTPIVISSSSNYRGSSRDRV